MRLRDKRLLAGMLHAHVRFVGLDARLDAAERFAPIDDTRCLLRLLDALLEPVPASQPRVAAVATRRCRCRSR
jgi:hypothetical protein